MRRRPGEELGRLVDGVGHPLDRDPARAALDPGVRLLGDDPRAGRLGDLRGPPQRSLAERCARQHQDRLAARLQRLHRLVQTPAIDPRGRSELRLVHRRVVRQLAPGGVGGQDQRRHARGRIPRRRDRIGGGAAHVLGARASADVFRHRMREALDVARQRRVVRQVVARMIAHHVDHRRRGPPRVVHVGETVGEAGPGVQQRRRRHARHPRVAVRGPGHHALEEPQHAAHVLLAVERRDEVHFGGARVGEADVHVVRQQGIAEQVGPVGHLGTPLILAP